ncbi:Methionyl-tRNA formyltransferase [Nitrincola lacisaponensis]|uniref:Methionyl-tRNA formyltransferase n=1 Tax=Nitrincola lacisaponensis TaxID=267850 RepID=A0A063Y490_9GAMM|nr:hypothetical protein [Nitrincola lacisaponensis]KDE41153.1 Methionyl-tRNA formyltransferase [Nitrincola lacisaponensis]
MDANNRVTILVDNDSWILPYALELEKALRQAGIEADLVRSPEGIHEGWVCFLIGCVHIVKDQYLRRNKHNLVVHESDLPKGRGFAPMAWQILEGANTIPVCLLEASPGEPDAGNIWLKDHITLTGDEMLPAWRQLQGEKTLELCLRFIDEYSSLNPLQQVGEPTWYRRRTPADSELDPEKSLRDQFNLLRIVDNDRYPAFFRVGEKKIIVKLSDSSS